MSFPGTTHQPLVPAPRPAAINYSLVAFPSDRIGIKYLRQRAPDRDASGNPGLMSREGDTIDAMMFLERGFARLGFEEATGIAGTAREDLADGFEDVGGVDGAAQELAEFYTHFGLATGPAAASELVRKVQAAGAAQAGRRTGRRR